MLAVFFTGCSDEEKLPPDTEAEQPASSPVQESKTTQGLKITPAIAMLDALAGDKTVAAHFTVTNVGKTPTTITGLDTTCSCLKVEAGDTVLDPGESTSIDALFDIGKIIGESEKMILVYTDKKPGRAVFLPVQVKVPPILAIEPKNVNWTLNDPISAKVMRFKTVRDKPINVLSVESSRPDAVSVSLKEIKKGREYEIEITPKATNDHVLGFVKIVTDIEIPTHQNQMGFFSITTP